MIEIVPGRVTKIAVVTEIDNVVEFEELATNRADAPTAVATTLD